MKKDDFFQLISKEPQLAEKMMKHLFNRLASIENKVASLATDTVPKRLIKLLLNLGNDAYSEAEKVITDKFTHEQLAQMLGIARQTVTTLINSLEKQKVISREGKRFVYRRSRLESFLDRFVS